MTDIDELLRRGEIDQAAALARQRGLTRRAAELLSLAGRHAEAVLVAIEAGEFRVALAVALAGGDERVVGALCAEIAKHPNEVHAAAAHARLAHRIDVAARILEATDPRAAADAWYEVGEYARAGRCFDGAGDAVHAIRAFEQHLAQRPEDVSVAERLAELRALRGDPEGAVRALQSAMRSGATPSVRRKLIDGLVRLGLDGSARAVLAQWQRVDAQAPTGIEACAGALPSSDGAEKRYAGRYRVVREVGSGATGRVLEALDELTGEPVALEVLSVGDDRGGAFQRFMREAELGRMLDDPTLVHMRALDPEGPTIVYDWMPGGTLAERIDALPLATVRAISMRLLSALETLHRHGVVHRDVKPSNILFDASGQARLGDLGAAHLNDLGVTVTGGLVGSLPYMAPEQITGASVSAATDMYAFGCVLMQMLTRTTPFAGPDFVSQHLSDPIPTVSARRPALGDAYDAAIEALLAKDALARPQQAGDARKLLSVLPWSDPMNEVIAERARISLVPSAPNDERTRYEPTGELHRFRDVRLGRDVDLVRIAMARKEAALRWAAADRTDLQPLYDCTDDGEWLRVWVEPLNGTAMRFDALGASERSRITHALAAVGLEHLAQPGLDVVRSPALGLVVPVSVLAEGSTGR